MSLYIRLSTQVLTDAKLMAAGSDGFTLWVKGLLYSKEHLTDGFVPEAAIPMLSIGIRRPKEAISRLLEGGKDALWYRVDAGYTVGAERWQNWQTTKDQVEEKRKDDRERKAEWRKNKKAKRNGHDATDVSPCDTPCDMSHVSQTCPTNVTSTEHRAQSTEHRAQSTEHRAQETRGSTTAPLGQVPVASPSTPPPDNRSPGANGEFMAAVGLLQELQLASTAGDIRVVAQVIQFASRDHDNDVERTVEHIRTRAIDARSRGEPVNIFWLKDRKFVRSETFSNFSLGLSDEAE